MQKASEFGRIRALVLSQFELWNRSSRIKQWSRGDLGNQLLQRGLGNARCVGHGASASLIAPNSRRSRYCQQGAEVKVKRLVSARFLPAFLTAIGGIIVLSATLGAHPREGSCVGIIGALIVFLSSVPRPLTQTEKSGWRGRSFHLARWVFWRGLGTLPRTAPRRLSN